MSEISVEQVRRFADTKSRLQIVSEVVERTANAWNIIDKKELLLAEMQSAIGKQIQAVLAGSRRNS